MDNGTSSHDRGTSMDSKTSVNALRATLRHELHDPVLRYTHEVTAALSTEPSSLPVFDLTG